MRRKKVLESLGRLETAVEVVAQAIASLRAAGADELQSHDEYVRARIQEIQARLKDGVALDPEPKPLPEALSEIRRRIGGN